MSPHAVGSFVNDLVEMAKAVEELPIVKQSLLQAQDAALELSDRINELELSLEAKTIYAAGLEQKVHNAEVARDDAEMRFLELEETSNTVRRILNDIANSAQNQARQITATLEKPQPQPEPVTTPTPSPEGQSVADPIPTETVLVDTQPTTVFRMDPVVSTADPSPEVTQSQADPIASDQDSSQSTPVSSVQEQAPVLMTPMPETSLPYSGKFYYDEPRYIPLELWRAGGGTEYGYNWRPEAKRSPL